MSSEQWGLASKEWLQNNCSIDVCIGSLQTLLSLSRLPWLHRHHWSIANTLPGIDCTFPNYICSGCHCGAIVKYLSKERSEATGRSHVLSGRSGTDSKVLFCYRKEVYEVDPKTKILNLPSTCIWKNKLYSSYFTTYLTN